jgi:hypothetical protein
VVTACSGHANYFSRLRNLVGSIHFWEPQLHVLVFDLGLNPSQRVMVSSWRNVKVGCSLHEVRVHSARCGVGSVCVLERGIHRYIYNVCVCVCVCVCVLVLRNSTEHNFCLSNL